jgi:hypothetical protein
MYRLAKERREKGESDEHSRRDGEDIVGDKDALEIQHLWPLRSTQLAGLEFRMIRSTKN